MKKKKSPSDNYIKFLDTPCELAKVNMVQVIEIVRNKKIESITNLLVY